jgi:hypothetical protein
MEEIRISLFDFKLTKELNSDVYNLLILYSPINFTPMIETPPVNEILININMIQNGRNKLKITS